MKNLICLFIAIMPLLGYSNPNVCENVFLMPFTNSQGQQSYDTRIFTDEVEEALTEFSSCHVLQRRNFDLLTEQLNNEMSIQSMEAVSEIFEKELQTIQAHTILFGRVEKDFSGVVSLRLSFESLLSKKILLQNSMFLVGDDAQNAFKRKERIRRFIQACINPEQFNEKNTWEDANETGTLEAYQSFIAQYPNSQYRATALNIIEDENAWKGILTELNDIKRLNLLENYRKRRFQRHIEEADLMLGDLLWKNRKYKQYLDLFPMGPYAEDANRRLHDRRVITTDLLTGLGKLAEGVAKEIIEYQKQKNDSGNEASEPSPPSPPTSTDPRPDSNPKKRYQITILTPGISFPQIYVNGKYKKPIQSSKNKVVISLSAGRKTILVKGKTIKCRKTIDIQKNMTFPSPCARGKWQRVK